MSDDGFPFLLDTDGNVWGFKKPFTLEEPIKLTIPAHVKKIAPFVALGDDGHVYTWSFDPTATKDWEPDDISNAIYTAPKLEKSVPAASDVFYSPYSYYAIGLNRRIYSWPAHSIWAWSNHLDSSVPRPHQMIEYDPPLSDMTSFSTSGFTTAYLLGSKRLVGWGNNNEGQLGTEVGTWPRPIVLPDWPRRIDLPEEASRVFVGTSHTLVLAKSGRVFIWGGCHTSGTDAPGNKSDIVSGVKYELEDIQDIAVSTDDNHYPDVFLMNDGTVWIGYPPTNTGVHNFACGYTYPDDSLTHQLKLPVPIVAVAAGGTGANAYPIIALGADNSLWVANFQGTPRKKWDTPGHLTSVPGVADGFHKLSINLNNQREESK
jgi:hypothetical protein